MNLQPIEKRTSAPLLSVHSIFYTIQGEGPFCGTPAVFVRLAGCNLQCPGCDTDYTSKRVDVEVFRVTDAVRGMHQKSPLGLVVITGGEPFRQAATGALIVDLIRAGFYVQIETNGALLPPVIEFVEHVTVARGPVESECGAYLINKPGAYIVCSPKTGKVNALTAAAACAFKYVLHSDSIDERDGLPRRVLGLGDHTDGRVARPPKGFTGPVYLQPMDSGNAEQNKRNLETCVASCLKFGYTLQLQVHKLIGVA